MRRIPFRHAVARSAILAAFGTLVLFAAGCGRDRDVGRGVAGSVHDPAGGRSATTTAPHGIRFDDVTSEAGIVCAYPSQQKPLRIIDALGFGCAAFDFDNDGWMDILVVSDPHPYLYRNRGGMRFEDVTSRAGLDRLKGHWSGVAVGDYDGDGKLDVLLTGYRRLALLRNLGAGTFRDETARAGLDPANHNHWATSAGFMDLDGSGRLSLVLCNYVVFNESQPQYCEFVPGVKSGCAPSAYQPEYPEIWRNVGGGRFKNVTADAGMSNAAGATNVHGKDLVVAFCDYDNDGKVDFYIGNDGVQADLLHNEGSFHFKNTAVPQGVALGVNQEAEASMGADWADYNCDGRMDLVTSAFSNEPYSLYGNVGAYFDNMSVRTGLAEPTRKPLGFGAKFIDADNDGWQDILFVNGHVYDNVDRIYAGHTFLQPSMLFYNRGGQRFEDIAGQSGDALARPILGRGAATADFDNDGRMDVLAVDFNARPMLLRNVTAQPGHWLQVELRARGTNRYAYGARATVRSGKASWLQDVSPASSYLSSSSPILHFGLGDRTTVDSVTVRWPDGRMESFPAQGVDRRIALLQGTGKPSSVPVRP